MVFGIDYRFVFKVAFYMLPEPRLKVCSLDDDRAEDLGELPIICEGFRCC